MLAVCVAWTLSAYRVGPQSVWDSDYRVAQCLSNQSVGWDGIVTAVLARFVRFLPVGTGVTRLGLISACAAGLSTWLLYQLTRELLARFETKPRLNAWLAFGAAVLFAASPSLADAASLPPGPLPTLSLLLLTLVVVLQTQRDASGGRSNGLGPVWVGLLIAAGLMERIVLFGSTLLLASLVYFPSLRRVPWGDLKAGLVAATVGLAALGVPWLLARKTALSLLLSDRVTGAWSLPQVSLQVPLGWEDDLGLVLLSLAALGASVVLMQPLRQLPLLLLLLALPAWCIRFEHSGSDASFFFRLLSLTSALALAAVGLRRIVDVLFRVRGGQSPLFATLAVILQITLSFAHADFASFRGDRYRSVGLDVFTQEAFAELPGSSVLLMRDVRLVRRLVAARYTDALRPDLLPVPMDSATNVSVVKDLLAREPALVPVLRELAINGRPSEFALSNLADARPVFLEFDPTWDFRLREHLLPLPYLSRLHSQSLGRSDRSSVVQRSQETLTRAFRATTTKAGDELDPQWVSPTQKATRELLQRRTQEQIILLLSLGDRPSVEALLTLYDSFEPGSPWSKALHDRMARTTKSLDAFDLLPDGAPPNDATVKSNRAPSP